MLPRIEQSPIEPDFVARPYDFYDRIRALGDFVFWEDYDMVVATSHEAVKAVLTHSATGRELPPSRLRTRPPHLATLHRFDDHSLLAIEAPEHTRLASAARAVLSDEMVLSLTTSISQLSDTLIDAFPRNTPFDLQKAFADKVPGITIMRFLGLPDAMHAQMQFWAQSIDQLMLARRDRLIEDAAENAALDFNAFMKEQLAEARGRSHPAGFIGHVLSDHKTLDDDDLISLVLLITRCGIQGVSHAIGNALYQLLRFPERRLALAPEQIESTVAECIRFEAPLQFVECYTQEDVQILDQSFKREATVGCLLGSACHDDAVWPDGNVFDPFRVSRGHMAFGAGVHACLGTALVRVMMKIALPALFSRCPTLGLLDDPKFTNSFPIRGLDNLIVQLDG